MSVLLQSNSAIDHRDISCEAAPKLVLKDVAMRIIKGRTRLSTGLSQVLCDWLILRESSLCHTLGAEVLVLLPRHSVQAGSCAKSAPELGWRFRVHRAAF